MSTQVVVLGAGYAGAGAVKRLERELGDDVELTWVSEQDYHLVLHEVHRVVRDPRVESKVAIPVTEIKRPSTAFVRGRAVGVDVDERTVDLDGGGSLDYDYLLVCVGTATAFYGIEGLREHSLTLKSLDDAREIHQRVSEAAAAASRSDPAEVLVGGAGLSGIQTAAEVAEYRDEHRAPIEVTLVEGLDDVFPGNDPEVQGALRKRLEELDVEILTGEFVSKVDDRAVYLGGAEEEVGDDADGTGAVADGEGDTNGEAVADGQDDAEPETEAEAEPGAEADGGRPALDPSHPGVLPYDVLVWTGGITGQDAACTVDVDKDERSHRLFAGSDFRTSDDRVFAVGDTALVEQPGDAVAPPTAQAAWQAAEVAGKNVASAVRGRPLERWTYEDGGTLVSVGETAVAHDVTLPVVGDVPINTFGGPAAKALKKAVACRWINDVSSLRRAVEAWGDM
jgi:NADH dehydrogenase